MEELALFFSKHDLMFVLFNNYHVDSNIVDYTLKVSKKSDTLLLFFIDDVKVFHHLHLSDVIKEAKDYYGIQ